MSPLKTWYRKLPSDLLDAKWLTSRRENFTRNKNNYRPSDAVAVAQTANKRRNFVRIREDSGLIAAERRRREQWSVCEKTGRGLWEWNVARKLKSMYIFVYPIQGKYCELVGPTPSPTIYLRFARSLPYALRSRLMLRDQAKRLVPVPLTPLNGVFLQKSKILFSYSWNFPPFTEPKLSFYYIESASLPNSPGTSPNIQAFTEGKYYPITELEARRLPVVDGRWPSCTDSQIYQPCNSTTVHV